MERFSGQREDAVCGSAGAQADIHDRWISFLTRNLFSYTLSRSKPRERAFRIDAKSRSVNGWTVARVSTAAGKSRLERTARDISQDGQDRFVAYLPVTGALELSQFDRTVACDPNVMTLISAGDPFDHIKLGDNDTVGLVMPRDYVGRRLTSAERECIRPIRVDRGVGHLAKQAMISLQSAASAMTDREFESAARMVGELVLLSLTAPADVASSNSSLRAAGLARVKRYIGAHFSDPDLALADIAAACGISIRYLHGLFRDDDRTAWEYLQSTRLQWARQMLEHTGKAPSVTEVALACGFSNMSQFSTAYKRAFAVSPRDHLRAG